MHIYYFEKMRVWQNARKLVNSIYDISKTLPKDENYHLVSQLRRSASSIKSNIAEGQGRKTKKDQAHFTTISYSSMIELVNHLDTALGLKYISEENYLKLREDINEIGLQLNALRRTQLSRIEKEKLK